jgi:hypothetical protein
VTTPLLSVSALEKASVHSASLIADAGVAAASKAAAKAQIGSVLIKNLDFVSSDIG